MHAAKGIGHAVAHPLDTLKNLVQGALGTVAGPIIHGLERAADGVLGRMGGIGSNMSHMVHIVGDKLLDLINSNDSAYKAAQAAAAGGGAGGGPISWNGGSNTIGLIEQLARSLPGGNAMQVTSTYRGCPKSGGTWVAIRGELYAAAPTVSWVSAAVSGWAWRCRAATSWGICL